MLIQRLEFEAKEAIVVVKAIGGSQGKRLADAIQSLYRAAQLGDEKERAVDAIVAQAVEAAKPEAVAEGVAKERGRIVELLSAKVKEGKPVELANAIKEIQGAAPRGNQ